MDFNTGIKRKKQVMKSKERLDLDIPHEWAMNSPWMSKIFSLQ